jgi:hypothetical protein
MELVIEGTWDEIKSHEAEFNGHRLMLIVDPEEPPNTIRDADHLEELLLQGLDRRGSGVEATPEFWANKEAELVARYGRAS